MILNVLAVGDVVGDSGVEYLSRHLRGLKKLKGVHFTVVNGENASGVGILPRQAREIFDAGADVVTLGNHTWNRIQIADFLEDDRYTLRPANYTSRVPGRGWGVYDGPGGVRIGVMNLIGRCEMDRTSTTPSPPPTGCSGGWRGPMWCWWTSTPRPPARRGPWGITWTAGLRPCGAPTPMSPPPTGKFSPRGWALSPTWV